MRFRRLELRRGGGCRRRQQVSQDDHRRPVAMDFHPMAPPLKRRLTGIGKILSFGLQNTVFTPFTFFVGIVNLNVEYRHWSGVLSNPSNAGYVGNLWVMDDFTWGDM
jgi:hypothetical protein